jgi:hypothetical protein
MTPQARIGIGVEVIAVDLRGLDPKLDALRTNEARHIDPPFFFFSHDIFFPVSPDDPFDHFAVSLSVHRIAPGMSEMRRTDSGAYKDMKIGGIPPCGTQDHLDDAACFP